MVGTLAAPAAPLLLVVLSLCPLALERALMVLLVQQAQAVTLTQQAVLEEMEVPTGVEEADQLLAQEMVAMGPLVLVAMAAVAAARAVIVLLAAREALLQQ